MARPLYRTRQVLHALAPRVDRDKRSIALELLSEAEAALFLAMQKRDQRHALEVTSRLRRRGVEDLPLLKAALLHDCGKGEVPVWLRVLYVQLPGPVGRAGVPDAPGWRGAAYRLANHGQIGARLAATAGAAPETTSLIEGRAHPGGEWRLELLRSADDDS